MKKLFFLALMCAMTLGTTAQAAFVSYDEAFMDSIFGQTIFKEYWPADGDFSIDIRFNPTIELVAPDLLTINSTNDLYSLWNNHSGGVKTVNAFFVDSLRACGGTIHDYGGCGEVGGNDLVVDSLSQSYNPVLLAHELGHNLNMTHSVAVSGDLMYSGYIDSDTTTISQATFQGELEFIYPYPASDPVDPNGILQGSFADGFFVEITPVLVVTAVPVPPSFLLLMSGLGVGVLITRRRKTNS
ncbi:MAG: hypothetical protein ABW166_13980 [Sedimenticola sp.]